MPVNRSAPTSLLAAVLAVVIVLLGLAAGGAVFQLLGLVALALAALGVAMGFVGVTVARAGAGRLALSILAMVVNISLALVILGLLVVHS